MRSQIAKIVVVLAACFASRAEATVILYATAPTQVNTGPQNLDTLGLPPFIDTFFDVFIKTDVPLVGVSLDVKLQGNAATITSAVLQNPVNAAASPAGGKRWLVASNGTVSPDGQSVLGLDGYTLNSTANPGLNPANATADAGYLIPAGSFHYARINYHLSYGTSILRLAVGANDLGVNTPGQNSDVFLGVTPLGQPPEPRACQVADFDCPGATSLYPEGLIYDIPEPNGLLLLAVAIACLPAKNRRRFHTT